MSGLGFALIGLLVALVSAHASRNFTVPTLQSHQDGRIRVGQTPANTTISCMYLSPFEPTGSLLGWPCFYCLFRTLFSSQFPAITRYNKASSNAQSTASKGLPLPLFLPLLLFPTPTPIPP